MSISIENIMNVSTQPKSTRTRKGGRQRERERKLHLLQEVGKKLTEVTLHSMFLHKSTELSLITIKAVVLQLNYHPYNLIDVVLDPLSSTPHPLVAILYPLNANDVGGRYAKKGGRKPFPTTLWIVSRDLYSRISKLEDMGWVQKLQRRLTTGHEGTSTNPPSDHQVNEKDGICTSNDDLSCSSTIDGTATASKLKDSGNDGISSGGGENDSMRWMDQMRMAHERYASFRWSLLNPDDVGEVTEKGWTSALKDVGIAGMASFDTVKCLHCHYAHHLARPQDGNIVGEWVAELLQQQQPSEHHQQVQPLEKISNNDSNQIHQDVMGTNNANTNDASIIDVDNSICSNNNNNSSTTITAHVPSSSSSSSPSSSSSSSSSSPSSSSSSVPDHTTPLDPTLINVPESQGGGLGVNRSFEVTPTTSFMCFRTSSSGNNSAHSNNSDSGSSCSIG